MRRLLPICSILALILGLSTGASALSVDWIPIGDTGNACDPQSQGCFGAVDYDFFISRTEVTNAQYAEFLNAAAASDPHALYNPEMASGFGGITRSGSDGSYVYTTIPGRENHPVSHVSFYDTLRFANWMHNGQGSGDTETGAYTITEAGIADNTITRNPGAYVFLTSEEEWYKAAYFDGTSFLDYPAGSDTQTVCAVPGATPNTANCDLAVGDLTAVGSYTASASPYGTFDQGGNVWEWNESIFAAKGRKNRGVRGGPQKDPATRLAAASRSNGNALFEWPGTGVRVAAIPGGAVVPEPGTALLVMSGLLGAAAARRCSRP